MAGLAGADREPGRGAGVTQALGAEGLTAALDEALARRTEANERFFAAEADRIADLCHHMAERFARGGRLIALGHTPVARSDVRHVTVEFVHPVIVGKRRAAGDRARAGGRPARRPGRAAGRAG